MIDWIAERRETFLILAGALLAYAVYLLIDGIWRELHDWHMQWLVHTHEVIPFPETDD